MRPLNRWRGLLASHLRARPPLRRSYLEPELPLDDPPALPAPELPVPIPPGELPAPELVEPVPLGEVLPASAPGLPLLLLPGEPLGAPGPPLVRGLLP